MTLTKLVSLNRNLSASASLACKLNNLLRESPFSQEIVAVVQHDPALTARLLRVCNTVAFQGTGNIGSLDEAIRRLGHQRLLAIVWQLCLGPAMRASLPVYNMKAETFWRHSLVTAIAAEELWALTSNLKEDKSTAFTAGLLHDIGKIVVDAALLATPSLLKDYCCRESLSPRQAEKQLCGYDHAVIGGELLKNWNLPATLVGATTFHHDPIVDFESNLSCLIHLADLCSHNLGESPGSYASRIPLVSEAFYRLSIPLSAMEDLTMKVQLRSAHVEAFMAI
jgi:putative nucleotidyltransferase with HDIG domain